ncbi:MAG: FIST N-terminal domain-containing protein [Acidimicrobiales bacterium]|nr:FIST N-terminal domain-containing protein [Acidimicrobiales bacterium]
MTPAGTATFGAAVSEHPDPAHAVAEAAGAVLDAVGPGVDVAFLFVTGPHVAAIDDIAAAVHAILRPVAFCGTSAGGVIGGATEVEEVGAVSVWAGHVGDAEAVRLETVRSPDGTAVVGMPDEAAVGQRTLVLLTDPHSFPTEAFVRASNDQYPNLTVVGGMASSGGPGMNRLLVQGEIHDDGAVGLLLPEGFDTPTVVSQGCRPVGEPLIVTASDGNLVTGLGFRPALDRLRELIDDADDHDRMLLSRGLHVGLVVDESAADFGPGDFLIRAVLGSDADRQGVRIGDHAPVGTTLQFHVRDAGSADADLVGLLGGVDADAALVFTCNGRGTAMFGEPDHDAELVSEAVNRGALAGMFCAGEIGPIRGENHVHGFTASVLLFYG